MWVLWYVVSLKWVVTAKSLKITVNKIEELKYFISTCWTEDNRLTSLLMQSVFLEANAVTETWKLDSSSLSDFPKGDFCNSCMNWDSCEWVRLQKNICVIHAIIIWRTILQNQTKSSTLKDLQALLKETCYKTG